MKGEFYGNYIASSTIHECKRNVNENSGEDMEFGATFIRGCNNPRKLPEEVPASPVKNQARKRDEPLIGFEKFRVRQGMPEFRPVEEGVQGPALSPPVNQESCTGSNPDGWNYVYESQDVDKIVEYVLEKKAKCGVNSSRGAHDVSNTI